MSIVEELQNYILREFSFNHNKKTIDPDENLLEQGIVDSSGIMQLTEYLEDKFGIQISNEDIVPENFQSINSLQKLIHSKQPGD